jgi:hypothetical protein
MSEAFSGHTTRSGRSTRPARTSAASRWVASTWLRSTCSRSPNGCIPTPGTLPCTSATVTGRPSPAPTGSRRTGHGHRHSQQDQRDGPAPRPERQHGRRRPGAPHSAVAKVTSGAPPTAAYGVNGDAVSAKASRPHGNPAERHRVPGQLLRHPQAGHPQRPARQPQHRRRQGTGQGQERGLEQRHQEPGVRPDDGQPGPAAERRWPGRAPGRPPQPPGRTGQRLSRIRSATPTGASGQRSYGRERQGDQRPADSGTGQPRTEPSRPPAATARSLRRRLPPRADRSRWSSRWLAPGHVADGPARDPCRGCDGTTCQRAGRCRPGVLPGRRVRARTALRTDLVRPAAGSKAVVYWAVGPFPCLTLRSLPHPGRRRRSDLAPGRRLRIAPSPARSRQLSRRGIPRGCPVVDVVTLVARPLAVNSPLTCTDAQKCRWGT